MSLDHVIELELVTAATKSQSVGPELAVGVGSRTLYDANVGAGSRARSAPVAEVAEQA